MEIPARGRLSLWPGEDAHHRATVHHLGLSLQGVSAHELQRLFLECRRAERGVCGNPGRAGDRWAARTAAALFLSLLHELDVYATAGDGVVRKCPVVAPG